MQFLVPNILPKELSFNGLIMEMLFCQTSLLHYAYGSIAKHGFVLWILCTETETLGKATFASIYPTLQIKY